MDMGFAACRYDFITISRIASVFIPPISGRSLMRGGDYADPARGQNGGDGMNQRPGENGEGGLRPRNISAKSTICVHIAPAGAAICLRTLGPGFTPAQAGVADKAPTNV